MKMEKNISADAISVGDQYFRVGASEIIWVVERRYVPPTEDIPHVALVREDGSDRVVISLFALFEGHSFKPDRRTTIASGAKFNRRQADWDPRRIWRRIMGERRLSPGAGVNQL